MTLHKFRHGLFAALLLISVVRPALSQTVSGSFHGAALDATGSSVPNVAIEIRQDETGSVRKTTTNDDGFYTARELPPGHYTVSASKTGFAPTRQSGIELLVNQDLELTFHLTLGTSEQEIQVQESALAVSTVDSTLGTVISGQQARDLPLNGRQFTQLILLTPGAAPKESGQQNSYIIPLGTAGISPSVNGQRAQENNFTIDGVSNNAIFNDTWAVSPPPDAIQEFKVQSHITDSQFGNSPGANVNVAIASGGNAVHGSVWEFVRNDVFDASNFFTNAVGQVKNPYRQNQYGLTFGSPVVLPKLINGRRSKTYIFGYWENFSSRQDVTNLLNVPNTAQLGGNFSAVTTPLYNPFSSTQTASGVVTRNPFPGNIIPPSLMNPAALAYLQAFYPAPNFSGSSNYATPVATSTDSTQYGAKIDQNFSNGDRLSGAVYKADVSRIVPPGLNYGTQITANPGGVVAIGYTHIFTSSWIGTLRYGHDFTNFNQYQTAAGETLANTIHSLGIMPEKYGLFSVPAVSITGLTSTNQTVVGFGPQRQHFLSGNMQKLVRSHEFTVGFLVGRVHSEDDGRSLAISFDQYPTTSINAAGTNVTTTGNALASMLLGLPSTIKGQVGSTNGDASGWQQGYYINDTWHVNSRLTLNYGLRYDYYQPLTWHKPVSGFVPSCQCIELSQAFGPSYPTATAPSSWFKPQYNGFQPRFGAAYKLPGNTVLRAGFAVFDDFNNNWIQQQLIERLSWPWGAGINLASLNRGVPTITFDNLPSAASILPQIGQPAPSPSYTWEALPTNKIPYSMLWNFGLEHQVSNDLLLKATYVGSASHHLYIEDEFNAPPPGPGAIAPRSPYPWLNQFQLDQNVGNSNYNALELSAQVRLHQGLTTSGSYTWSHCFSIQDAAQDFSNQDPYNRRPDYSSCDQDIRHILTANYTYELPFGRGKGFAAHANAPVNALISGWRMSGILTWETGLPFTVTVPVDNANIGQTAEVQRAELVGNPLPSGFQQSVNGWYNAAAFAVPMAYTYGNLGRNILRAPGVTNFDMNVNKEMRLRETVRLRFGADFFNLPNHTELNAPGASVTTATFLHITSAKSSRDIQFSLKLSY